MNAFLLAAVATLAVAVVAAVYFEFRRRVADRVKLAVWERQHAPGCRHRRERSQR